MNDDHPTMTVHFPIRPEVEMIGDNEWRVVNTFHVVIEEEGKETIVHEVPHGFVSNFASVPRAPVAYLLFGGIGNVEALLHDDLYDKGIYSREWCDAVYYHALLGNPRISKWKARQMYEAICWFGESHYNDGGS